MGYSPNDKNNIWENAEFITEVQTKGEDTDGYKNQETIGVAKTEFGNLCIFKGSTDRHPYEQCSTIHISSDGHKLSKSLFELAEKLKELKEILKHNGSDVYTSKGHLKPMFRQLQRIRPVNNLKILARSIKAGI